MFQSVIFHLERHPNYTWYHQCVTFNFFPSHDHELAYNLFNFVAVYLVPLIVIIVSYALILRVMSKKARENRGQSEIEIRVHVDIRKRDKSSLL